MKKLNIDNISVVEWYAREDGKATIDFLEGKISQIQLSIIKSIILEQAKQMEKEQIEISDMEIYNNAPVHDRSDYSIGQHHGFMNGAKWYRKQIKIKK